MKANLMRTFGAACVIFAANHCQKEFQNVTMGFCHVQNTKIFNAVHIVMKVIVY